MSLNNLISPMLVHFKGIEHQPDCLEIVSNACLYPIRAAMGMDCRLIAYVTTDRIALDKKIHSTALRALAGLIALTIWLPFTILGIIFWNCSKTHSETYTATKL